MRNRESAGLGLLGKGGFPWRVYLALWAFSKLAGAISVVGILMSCKAFRLLNPRKNGGSGFGLIMDRLEAMGLWRFGLSGVVHWLIAIGGDRFTAGYARVFLAEAWRFRGSSVLANRVFFHLIRIFDSAFAWKLRFVFIACIRLACGHQLGFGSACFFRQSPWLGKGF